MELYAALPLKHLPLTSPPICGIIIMSFVDALDICGAFPAPRPAHFPALGFLFFPFVFPDLRFQVPNHAQIVFPHAQDTSPKSNYTRNCGNYQGC